MNDEKEKSKFPLHPFFFTVYPPLFLYAHNFSQVSFGEFFVVVLFLLIITSLLFFGLSFLIKEKEVLAIVLSVFIVFFYLFAHISSIVSNVIHFFIIQPIPYGKTIFAIGCAILFGYLAVRFSMVAKKHIHFVSDFLYGTSIIMLLFPTFLLGNKALKYHAKKKKHMVNNTNLVANSSFSSREKLPDIYYIVLDGYGGNEGLKDTCGYDNSKFTDKLKQLGFYVAYKSKPNYPCTYLSMASCLNLKYVNYLAEYHNSSPMDVSP